MIGTNTVVLIHSLKAAGVVVTYEIKDNAVIVECPDLVRMKAVSQFCKSLGLEVIDYYFHIKIGL